nr:hypothetical protein [Acidobacteriota bacterium]
MRCNAFRPGSLAHPGPLGGLGHPGPLGRFGPLGSLSRLSRLSPLGDRSHLKQAVAIDRAVRLRRLGRLVSHGAVLALLAAPQTARPATAQPLASSLTYTAVAPCRILDTRSSQGGAGPLVPGQVRTVNVAGGSSGDFTGQGGHPGGCSVPG